MADFYSYSPGTLIKIPTGQQGASLLTLDGLIGNASAPLLIGTTFGLDRVQDVEYQKTLTGIIYAYAFGEGVGRIQVGGLLFFAGCDGGGQSGIKALDDYYSKNNIYTRTPPIIASIGGVQVSGYLETMSANLESSEFNYGSFNLIMSRLPKYGA